MTPRIAHREFLLALASVIDAYAILAPHVRRALPQRLARVVIADPLSRAVREEFGSPLVRWFDSGEAISGVGVADGTLMVDVTGPGLVRFLPGVAAEHRDDLPDGWQEQAVIVARENNGRLVLR